MLQSFLQIVEANTSVRQRSELYKVLREAGLYDGLRSAIDTYLCESLSASGEARQQKFRVMVIQVLTQINQWYRSQPPDDTLTPSARRIIQLGFILLKQIVTGEHSLKQTFLQIIEEIIEKNLQDIDWKHFSFTFFGAEVLSPFRSNHENASDKKRQHNHSQAYFLWHIQADKGGKKVVRVHFARDICRELPGVRNQYTLNKLFVPRCSDYYIEVPSEYLRAFIALFRLQVKAGRIRCCHNKGFYKLLQMHVILPENKNKVQSRDFYAIDYETRHNAELEAEVMEILHPLLEIYLP
jgi:hypothetical protein